MKVLRSHITDIEKVFDLEIAGSDIDIPELVNQGHSKVGIYSMGENYFAHGSINGELKLICDLCLSEYSQDVDSLFEVYIQNEAGEDVPDGEDVDIIHLRKQDAYIDFSEFFHDLFLLEIPIQKKCRPDCRGLCAVCGGNLNIDECSHESGDIDPRWAALQELKKQMN